MDNETAAALSAVQSVFDRPELHVELGFEPGQIQYVNNRATGHARTEFIDHPGARAQTPSGAAVAARRRKARLSRLTAMAKDDNGVHWSNQSCRPLRRHMMAA